MASGSKRQPPRNPLAQPANLGEYTQPAEIVPSVDLRYDYEQVDAAARDRVISLTRTLKPLLRRNIIDAYQIGLQLAQVKELLAHGQFSEWLAAEFDLGERTAQRYMTLAERLSVEQVRMAAAHDVNLTSLMTLAAPSTPDMAVTRFFSELPRQADTTAPTSDLLQRILREARREENRPKPMRPGIDYPEPSGRAAPRLTVEPKTDPTRSYEAGGAWTREDPYGDIRSWVAGLSDELAVDERAQWLLQQSYAQQERQRLEEAKQAAEPPWSRAVVEDILHSLMAVRRLLLDDPATHWHYQMATGNSASYKTALQWIDVCMREIRTALIQADRARQEALQEVVDGESYEVGQ